MTIGGSAPIVASPNDRFESGRQAARGAGTLDDLVNPGVTADSDYATAFLHKLTDISLAVMWGSVEGGTDPYDVDSNINAVVVRGDQLEQEFLAGEDRGFTVRIVRADGTVFESDAPAPRRRLRSAAGGRP